MSYSTVDFDTVAPLMPYDKTASMVAGKGEHFEWEPENGGKTHSRDPIATRAPEAKERFQPGFVDLKGVKIGRFTVMGIAAELKTCNGQNWVLRCVCGSYETRKAKYIKSCVAGNRERDPMCDWCRKTNRLRMGIHDPKKAAAAAQAIQSMNR